MTNCDTQCAAQITYNWEINSGRGELGTPFLDILGPLVMFLQPVGGDTDDLDIARGKVRSPG